jgi:hypothetical protein
LLAIFVSLARRATLLAAGPLRTGRDPTLDIIDSVKNCSPPKRKVSRPGRHAPALRCQQAARQAQTRLNLSSRQ